MKKIAGILICIALALGFTGCSWQIPEKVDVYTNAEYHFSLGNFKQKVGIKVVEDPETHEKKEKDLFSVETLLGDIKLPNNGKIYDYWPNKKGDTQKLLMYMPIQEIPIDISSYFDSGALADQIKNISFEKEIEVPEVSFSFPLKFELNKINEEINKQFLLAGFIQDYSASAFGQFLKDKDIKIADTISYSKGVLVVKAYQVDADKLTEISSGSSIQNCVSDSDLDTSYSYGKITITSGGKKLSGFFRNGVAELIIPESGFDFKTDDISINFDYKPTFMGFPSDVFIAKIDPNRDYQIKSVSGIGSTVTIPAVSFNEKFDVLKTLEESGVEECRIGTGKIDIDFDIPAEWENVSIAYNIAMSGGINVTSTEFTAAAGNSSNVGSISLDGKDITKEEITVNAAFVISIQGATIDFTKAPAIGFDSSISRIDTVTVKLSGTSLSFAETQPIPEEVLTILKQIELGQCGIKGTYTNTLPEGNEVALNISSDFFGLSNKQQTIAGGKNNEPFALLTSEEIRTINLTSDNPAPAGKYNAFDFNVGVSLPGGEANKVTVKNVSPGQTYKLAVNVEPVINWQSVTIDTSSLESQHDTVGTNFNPDTIFSSVNAMLGEGFINNIDLPSCNLYLYLTQPDLDVLSNLNFKNSTISMFYGKSDTCEKIGDFQMDIIKDGIYKDKDGQNKPLGFAKAAPSLKVEKLDEDSDVETVTSLLNTNDASFELSISELLKSTPDSNADDAQLCISYNIDLSAAGGLNGLKITKADLDAAESNTGSIGIYAVIELAFELAVKGGTDIDLLNFIDLPNDGKIIDLSQINGWDQISQYLNVIQSIQIDYKINSFPVVTSKDIQIKLDLGDDSNSIYKRPKLDKDGKVIESLKFNTSSGTEDKFAIESSDIENLLTASLIKLREAKLSFVNDNTISIPRERIIDVNLQIDMKTDGKIPLFESNK